MYRLKTKWRELLVFLAVILAGGNSVFGQELPTDVTGYETVTVTIPATNYDVSQGAPQMARVKYNKLFPLIITSDDMGKTELTNNWAALNGYPIINDHVDLGIQPGGTKFLQTPYKKYYTQGESQNVDDHAPMIYTDNVGKTQRYRMTSAIMPYELKADGSSDYSHIDANDAKLMLRTGFSFAQHNVNIDKDNVANSEMLSELMTTNNATWTSLVGIGLKVMVEPDGNHSYLDAGKANSGICWNIFQNPTTNYPANSKAITDWTDGSMPSTFSNKPTGGFTRSFFQGQESKWKAAVDAADGSSMIIGGTHGIGDDIKDHLRTSANIKNNAWVGSADEVWEYYHIYNNLKIENVTFADGYLTFDIQVPTYQKNQFRELTLNIPGLTSTSAPIFSTADGKTIPVTGGYNPNGGSGIGYTMNIGLESSINTHIEQLLEIYRDDQTNLFVKRDVQYLIDQLWDDTAKTAYQSQLDANPTYDLTVQSSLGTTLATIKTDTNGDKSFAVPRYIVNDDKLYEVAANSERPYYVKTITTTSTPSAIAYTEGDLTSLKVDDYTPKAVLLVEGEDMTGAAVVGADFDSNDNSSRYHAMRIASMGMGGCIVSGTPAIVTNNLPRGKYKMVIGYGNSNSGTTTYNVCVGGSSVYSFNTSAVSSHTVTEFTSSEFDIEVDNTPITITSDYTESHPEKGSRWIDYIYVVKTNDLAAALPTITFVSSAVSTNVKTNTTITITATAVPNGGTDLVTKIYAADSEGNPTGDALAMGTNTASYDFTPITDGYYFFVAQSTNSVGTTTTTVMMLNAVSIENYTLSIVDKSGNIALSTTISNPVSPETDPLPDAYRSPFAENYHYYLTTADAQDNNTANALATTASWSNTTIYVGYDAKHDFNSENAFAVWANNQYLHMVYRISQAGTNNRYYITNQQYDISDVPSGASSAGDITQHTITASDYALLDNHFMWDLGNDPYNVIFKNKGNDGYFRTKYNENPVEVLSTSGDDYNNRNHFAILYWQGVNNNKTEDTSIETNADYYLLYDRSTSTSTALTVGNTNNHYLACTDNQWRSIDKKHGSYNSVGKIYIKALPKVTVNVLNSHGDVEAQIQAYNNPSATMQSFIPYSMLRAYTSGHTLYYDAAKNNSVSSGSELNTSTLSNNDGNLYMTYTLNNEKWRTIVQNAVTDCVMSYDAASDNDINWYGIRYNDNNSNYLTANALSTNLTTTGLAGFTGTNVNEDSGKKAQWALMGTPYHLEIANRFWGITNLLGIPSAATTASKAQVYAAGTSDVITTWEAVTWLNGVTSHIFIRPQGGYNGQAPYLYFSGPSGLSQKASGGEKLDFYWATTTTEHFNLNANEADGNRWTTFYCGKAGYDITTANTYAYTATVGQDVLTLTKIGTSIPKGQAVIIVSETNPVSLTRSEDGTFTGTNDLRGVDVRTETASLGTGTFYVMSKKDDDFGFFEYTGNYMPAHKAYLLISGEAPARGFTMVFGDEDTGITTTNLTNSTNTGTWYTLNGVKLSGKPTKAGLYIHGNRKVSIK